MKEATILTRKTDERLDRSFDLEIRAVNEEERSVELAFSSEFPVMRWGCKEILWHDKSAVQLGRLRQAGSLLFAHGRDPNYGVMPVGKITDVRLDEDRIARAKVQFNTDEKSELVWQNVKNGSIRGVSFGYSVSQWKFLDAKTEWNGFKGPAYIGMRWEPYEISLEPTPADPTVGIGRSEPPQIEAEPITEEEKTLDPKEIERMQKEAEDKVRSELSGQAEEAIRKAVETERTRVIEVMAICRDSGLNFEDHKSATVETVRKAAYDALVARSKAPATPPVEVRADESDKFRAAASEALMARAGIEGAEVKADNPFRYMKLLDMARAALEAKDGSRHFDLPPLEVAQRAMFGTSDFPYILANVAKKSLVKAYDLAPSTWQMWCKEVSTSDFKTMYVNSLSEAPDLVQKYPGGAYKMATFSEYQESYAVSTYGREYAMTREMIINDDLGAFNRISKSFGTAAKGLVNSLPYAILVANGNMADGNALFDATYHKNYAPSAGALSVTTLATAFAAFRRQTDASGNRVLNVQPKFLIIPPELEAVAMQLLNSVMDPTLTNSAAVNPYAGRLQIVVDAELTDTNDWFLAANPNQIDTIEVCFLEGFRGPVIESKEDFATDSIKIKVRQDVGAKAIDWRGLYLGHNA